MDAVTEAIVGFLEGIGIPVRHGDVGERTIVPGIRLERGALIIDLEKMTYPGDLLHEAGHLAVLTAEERQAAEYDIGVQPGAEMAAIAWSWAAALAIPVDPEVVFHAGGYRAGSAAILENFREGRYFGVPLLQWMGLTAEATRAKGMGVAPFPHMLRWLRE